MFSKILPRLVMAFGAVLPMTAIAQTGFVQPLSTDADALATQMRTLAANPQDVAALVTAGELSLKLDDVTAAAAFFARAEKVDPRNGRMKAGEASLLVRSERPGEALRYFAQAESYGFDARRFAADRALAYDLVGEQERAQRDYRVALKSGADDETVRRYALSLGISGKREQALEQLAPLIRKSDRGAWRARAFILAMGGDVRGAETIATTMMPPGMASGLQPFFDRLPTLPAIDRAFAVHFGEVRAGSQRFADARLAPALTPLGPESGVPVQMASVSPAAVAAEPKGKRKEREKKAKAGRVQLAAVPIPTPAKVDLPPTPPVYRSAQGVALAQAAPVRSFTARTDVAPLRTTGTAISQPSSGAIRAASAGVQTAATQPPPFQARQNDVSPMPHFTSATPVPAQPRASAVTRAAMPIAPATEARLEAAKVNPTPGFSAGSTSVAAATRPAAEPTAPANTVSRAGEDSILARIVAGLAIPASELGVDTPGAAEPTRAAATLPVHQAAPDQESARKTADALTAKREAADKKLADRKLAADKAAADKKATADKAAKDKKALAAKKALADKKELADKAAAEKKAAKADPERIWVQVAGGANEGDLSKAWASVKAKAPKVFAGHQGYTTPLRATNRVATGPFKTDDEARAFVNALAKKGVSAFTFTSDKGQKVERLGSK